MGDKEQRFVSLPHDPLEKVKCAVRALSVEVAGRFVSEDHARIVCESACDRDALLFAAGKMTAGSGKLAAEIDGFEQFRCALAHLVF